MIHPKLRNSGSTLCVTLIAVSAMALSSTAWAQRDPAPPGAELIGVRRMGYSGLADYTRALEQFWKETQ